MTKEEVLEKVLFHAKLRGLSKSTQEEYYTKAKLFQNHFDKLQRNSELRIFNSICIICLPKGTIPLEQLIPTIADLDFCIMLFLTSR